MRVVGGNFEPITFPFESIALANTVNVRLKAMRDVVCEEVAKHS